MTYLFIAFLDDISIEKQKPLSQKKVFLEIVCSFFL